MWCLLRDVLAGTPSAHATATAALPNATPMAVPIDGSATFADLGCANGRALATTALLPLELNRGNNSNAVFFGGGCFGVELLPSLAEAAVAAGEQLKELYPESGPWMAICGRIEETASDWGKCDVVYACSTCYSNDLLHEIICAAADHLRPGALLVTLTIPPPEARQSNQVLKDNFGPGVAFGPYEMSWGAVVAHCHVKN